MATPQRTKGRPLGELELRIYTVSGMGCNYCRSAVTEEVDELEDVETVEVDLGSDRLEVRGGVSGEAVEAAVVEAGYALAAGS